MELYYGVVEDIHDPKKLGRVKVRIINVHSKDKNLIPTADLPWALVMAGTTTPSISGVGHSTFLLQGSWVVGTFTDVNLQAFLIMGSLPTMSGNHMSSAFGFTDPNGQYPRANNEEDNNLRTRGNPDPNDYEVQGEYQPRSAYAPVYPYNHVYESESGHIKEYDDTPGSQRIRERHNSGTYYEVQPGGSKIERVVADNYELILGDDTIEVKGNVNIIVSEDVNLSCAGNVTANVGNNVDFLVNGDVNGEVRGNIAMRVGPNKDDHVTIADDGTEIHHTYDEGITRLAAIDYWRPQWALDELELYTGDGYLANEEIPDEIQSALDEWQDGAAIELINGEWVYQGESLIAAQGGHVDLHIEGNITGLIDGNVNMTVLRDVDMTVGNNIVATVAGNTVIDCSNTFITGDVRIDGDLSVGKDVKADNGNADTKVSLYNHDHTGDGGGGLSGHADSTSSPNADD